MLTPKWLPYEPMLIPLATVWSVLAATTGPAQGAMRAKLKRWFWCASFTGEFWCASFTGEYESAFSRTRSASSSAWKVARSTAAGPVRCAGGAGGSP